MLLLISSLAEKQILCTSNQQNLMEQEQNKTGSVIENTSVYENESFFSTTSEILLQIKTDLSKNVEQKTWELKQIFYDRRISDPYGSFYIQTDELVQGIEHLRNSLSVLSEFIILEKMCICIYHDLRDYAKIGEKNSIRNMCERGKIAYFIRAASIFVTRQYNLKELNANVIQRLLLWNIAHFKNLSRLDQILTKIM
ncbi:hypothetical protein CDIK_2404 [Cucumispora dikerogammari]|nr:hypothetical protein CDIK_2404 [Cucumispora dikerogammari]